MTDAGESVTRWRVLEGLGAASDAGRERTTSFETLASKLDADERTIEAHLDGLVACDLARRDGDEHIRVTITGEQLLELDVDEMVIVDPGTADADN